MHASMNSLLVLAVLASAHPLTTLQPRIAASDLGKCSNIQMDFGKGFPDRAPDEDAFQANDLKTFAHGAALNPGVIMNFMCDTLVNACKLAPEVQADCKKTAALVVADQQSGKKGGILADTWNAAFGIKTSFATGAATSGGAAPDASTPEAAKPDASAPEAAKPDAATPEAADPDVSTPEAANPDATNAGATKAGGKCNKAADSKPAAKDSAPAQDGGNGDNKGEGETAGAGAQAGGNLQTFTGKLGGVPAAVTVGGRGFNVEGNASFDSKKNALVRSCDVQHNKCSNGANSSGNKGELTVAACGKQQEECNALAQ